MPDLNSNSLFKFPPCLPPCHGVKCESGVHEFTAHCESLCPASIINQHTWQWTSFLEAYKGLSGLRIASLTWVLFFDGIVKSVGIRSSSLTKTLLDWVWLWTRNSKQPIAFWNSYEVHNEFSRTLHYDGPATHWTHESQPGGNCSIHQRTYSCNVEADSHSVSTWVAV